MVGKLWTKARKHLSSAYAWSLFFVAFLGLLGGALTGGATDTGTRENTPFSFGGLVSEEGILNMEEGALRAEGGAEDSFFGDIPAQNAEDGALREVSGPVKNILAERSGKVNEKVVRRLAE
ncbi:MAG: hypothetical protein Q8R20_03405 [Nanoarchaeota archaeon]|nr:hypothetical protein [Nanoarchaeota archaeon]